MVYSYQGLSDYQESTKCILELAYEILVVITLLSNKASGTPIQL